MAGAQTRLTPPTKGDAAVSTQTPKCPGRSLAWLCRNGRVASLCEKEAAGESSTRGARAAYEANAGRTSGPGDAKSDVTRTIAGPDATGTKRESRVLPGEVCRVPVSFWPNHAYRGRASASGSWSCGGRRIAPSPLTHRVTGRPSRLFYKSPRFVNEVARAILLPFRLSPWFGRR